MNEQTVFVEAMDLTANERSSFLDKVCAGHPELRARVERLFNAHDAAAEFMEQPAVSLETQWKPVRCELFPAGTMVDSYRIIELIGEGGFGTVFLAEQVEPVRRNVALKIVKPGMDTARSSPDLKPSGTRWPAWTTPISHACSTSEPPMRDVLISSWNSSMGFPSPSIATGTD